MQKMDDDPTPLDEYIAALDKEKDKALLASVPKSCSSWMKEQL